MINRLHTLIVIILVLLCTFIEISTNLSNFDNYQCAIHFDVCDNRWKEIFIYPTSNRNETIPVHHTTNKIKSTNKFGHSKFPGPQNKRQIAVVNEFRHAWNGYVRYAYGKDVLRPIAATHQSEWFGTALTMIDALDTMIIMGLDNEFQQSKSYLKNNLKFDLHTNASLFEITIRVLGGLLSAYHLSGDDDDRILIDLAENVANRLMSAFKSSPIPYTNIDLKTSKSNSPTANDDLVLAEVTSIQLEFRELSRITGNSIYEQKSFEISKHIHRIGCSRHDGLCPMFINRKDGRFWQEGGVITLGGGLDSHYEYLLKQWIQTGKTINWLLDDYKLAINSIENKLIRYSKPNKLLFIGEMLPKNNKEHISLNLNEPLNIDELKKRRTSDRFIPKMDHLVCYLSGTLALGVMHGLPKKHAKIAKKLAYTCNEMHKNAMGLAPEIVHFNMENNGNADYYIKPGDEHYRLRPETIESLFYLHRLTNDSKYQDWGWQIFRSIRKHARVANGYVGLKNVTQLPIEGYIDLMETYFLSETLKYLYLLFADNTDLMPLDRYVFNTQGHPLPIREN